MTQLEYGENKLQEFREYKETLYMLEVWDNSETPQLFDILSTMTALAQNAVDGLGSSLDDDQYYCPDADINYEKMVLLEKPFKKRLDDLIDLFEKDLAMHEKEGQIMSHKPAKEQDWATYDKRSRRFSGR